MTDLLQRMATLAEEMDDTAGAMLLTKDETASFHAHELLVGAAMMRDWVKGLSCEHA